MDLNLGIPLLKAHANMQGAPSLLIKLIANLKYEIRSWERAHYYYSSVIIFGR